MITTFDKLKMYMQSITELNAYEGYRKVPRLSQQSNVGST
jgi:hypothetical protein